MHKGSEIEYGLKICIKISKIVFHRKLNKGLKTKDYSHHWLTRNSMGPLQIFNLNRVLKTFRVLIPWLFIAFTM